MLNYIQNKKEYSQTIIYIETELGSGSGFIVTANGYAITCAHVVNGCNDIYVKVKKDSSFEVYQANLICIDTFVDIAIIKIEENSYFYAQVEFDNYDAFSGEEIIIYGYPFGKQLNDEIMNLDASFSRGYVSSNQTIDGIKKTLLDISAKAGNSGSPIISLETGKIIGILCGSLHGGLNNMEEINYMIPITYLNRILQ